MIQGELEQDIHVDMYLWAYGYYKAISPDDVTTRQMSDDYWNQYINSCAMSTPETGLEMPHEEDLSYTYNPNADEYNSSYGW